MIDQIAATKCRRRSSLTDDADHALRMAEDRAEALVYDAAGVHPPAAALWG